MIRAEELIGAQLDLWAARAEGMPVYECGTDSWPGNGAVHCEAFRRRVITVGLTGSVHVERDGNSEPYAPSGNWAQGGPIIEREGIDTNRSAGRRVDVRWQAIMDGKKDTWGLSSRVSMFGPTSLIAAMRAFVASKFGDEFDETTVAQEAAEQKGGDNHG
jgi:hypothetical protein